MTAEDLIAQAVHKVDCGCGTPTGHTDDSLTYYAEVAEAAAEALAGRLLPVDAPAPLDAIFKLARHLNQPMTKRLRACAADTSPNYDGWVTIYPPEARELVGLIDALASVDPPTEGVDHG